MSFLCSSIIYQKLHRLCKRSAKNIKSTMLCYRHFSMHLRLTCCTWNWWDERGNELASTWDEYVNLSSIFLFTEYFRIAINYVNHWKVWMFFLLNLLNEQVNLIWITWTWELLIRSTWNDTGQVSGYLKIYLTWKIRLSILGFRLVETWPVPSLVFS